jgi:hypothetical protein
MDIEPAIEFILEREASTAAKLEELAERQLQAEKNIAALNTVLRRAIRLSVEEQRRERERRQQMFREFDDKITKLAAAQLQAEEETRQLKASVQAFIDSMRRGGNGEQ